MNQWNILVVEDEPDGQEVIRDILENHSIGAETVGLAETAIQCLGEKSYTGLIIDLALPGMDGMNLLQTIRNNDETAHLPCLAITAYHNSLVKQQALEAGFNAYLSKPFNEQSLMYELKRIMK
jgi:CheY-like chemotaxis protein